MITYPPKGTEGRVVAPWDAEIDQCNRFIEAHKEVLENIQAEVDEKHRQIAAAEARRNFWTRVKTLAESDGETLEALEKYVAIQMGDL